MTYTHPEPSHASPWIRALGRVSRSTPYFKGKWRVMGWTHRRWFVKKRMWDDAQLSSGTVVACDLWDKVQFDMWWGGETYEIRQAPYFKSLLKPQCVVFDIGANVGYYSLIAAPLVGPEGRIYAFEPAAEQFRHLKDNATRNGFSQILPYKVALSDKPGGLSSTLMTNSIPAQPSCGPPEPETYGTRSSIAQRWMTLSNPSRFTASML